MMYLLDTCIISEFSRRRPSSAVVAWLETVSTADLYLSAVTIGEMQKGVAKLPIDDPMRRKLVMWVDSIEAEFSQRVLQFDAEIAKEWGRIVGEALRIGRVRPLVDMQIAATAFKHGMILVTRNTKDMKGVGVELLNPFEFQSGA